MSANVIKFRPVGAKPLIERTPAGQVMWAKHADDLRRFHREGRTSGWVAAHYGVTRNAIIGAWSRLGLPQRKMRTSYATRKMTPEEIEARKELRRQRRDERQRAQQSRQLPPQRRTQGSILAQIHAAPEPSPAADTGSKPVVPILVQNEKGQIEANERLTSKTCRWWIGDVLDPRAGFCPEHKVEGLSYCQHHARIAFAAPTVRRPRAAPAPKPERIPTFADAESA